MSTIKYNNLFKPIKLGNTIFRNRIFGAPTGYQNLTLGKYPPAEAVEYYERKAMGGAATVTVGECVVDSMRGRGGENHIALDDSKSMGSLSALAEGISKHGAVAVAELQHAGMFAKASAEETGGPLYGPVDMEIKGAVVHAETSQIHAMPEEIIEETIEAFGNAALFAKEAGFGMVLVHGGHGWLLSQFMSPIINTRTDKWGGSFENRMRLTLEICDRIKQKCGKDFPIEFRMSGSEANPDGYDIDEGIRIAKAIDGHVDLIHVSTGNHEVHDAFVITHPSMFHPDGCNLKYAAAIKKAVKTPVATVGAFADPELMEEVIRSEQADVICVARGLIADPDLPQKARANKPEDITPCMRCLACFSNLITKQRFVCAVNPVIGFEKDSKFQLPTPKQKKILIAGGGVAGMQAALTAAERGHNVILCEKTNRLGGALLCEEAVSFKQKLSLYLERQARKIQDSGAEIRMNTKVTSELAESIGPDVIIAALGARPIVPTFIKGIDRKNVMGAEQAYVTPDMTGDKIVVLGGGLVGTELGIYLAGLGKKVTILEMMPTLNDGGNILHAIALDVMIRKLGITLALGTKAMEITESGIIGENAEGQKYFEADTIIYAIGQRPLADEAAALSSCAPEFHMLGDCTMPKNIMNATRTAYNIVRNIGI